MLVFVKGFKLQTTSNKDMFPLKSEKTDPQPPEYDKN